MEEDIKTISITDDLVRDSVTYLIYDHPINVKGITCEKQVAEEWWAEKKTHCKTNETMEKFDYTEDLVTKGLVEQFLAHHPDLQSDVYKPSYRLKDMEKYLSLKYYDNIMRCVDFDLREMFNKKMSDGKSMFSHICELKNKDMTKHIIRNSLSKIVIGNDGETILHYMMKYFSSFHENYILKIITQISEGSLNLDFSQKSKMVSYVDGSPLHYYFQQSPVVSVSFLRKVMDLLPNIKNNLNNMKGYMDATVLHIACTRCNLETMVFLIEECGMNVSSVMSNKENAVHSLCSDVNKDMEKKLKYMMGKYGSDILDAKNSMGKTPIILLFERMEKRKGDSDEQHGIVRTCTFVLLSPQKVDFNTYIEGTPTNHLIMILFREYYATAYKEKIKETLMGMAIQELDRMNDESSGCGIIHHILRNDSYDLDFIKAFLVAKKGLKLNKKDKNGEEPIFLALRHRKDPAFHEYLIDNKDFKIESMGRPIESFDMFLMHSNYDNIRRCVYTRNIQTYAKKETNFGPFTITQSKANTNLFSQMLTYISRNDVMTLYQKSELAFFLVNIRHDFEYGRIETLETLKSKFSC